LQQHHALPGPALLLLKIPKQLHSEATYVNTIKYCFQTFAGLQQNRACVVCLNVLDTLAHRLT
jgi:hypothetical protein